jgi:hypothetical protein
MSFRKLFQLSLVGVALLVAKAADGQSLQGACQAKVKVNSVKYLGRQSGQDQVEVRWSTEAASECIKFGGGGSDVPPAQQDSFTAPAAAGFAVRVFVKRRFEHRDEATVTKKEIVPAGSNVLTIVNIPRGVAETDPQAYIVTITTFSGGATQKRAVVTGTGLPNLSAATQTFQTFTSYPNLSTVAAECFPEVQVTGLTFVASGGAAPDSLTLNWNAASATADCIGQVLFISLSARVRRADGTQSVANVGESEISGNARTKTLQLGSSNSPVVSYKIVVAVSKRFGVDVKGVESGNF